MLSKELEFTLNAAFKEARNKRHEFMTVEHLLLALLDNPAAAEVLRACGADIDVLRTDLDGFLEETTPLIMDEDGRETQPTLGFQRVLQRAVFHVQSSGKSEVTGATVLVDGENAGTTPATLEILEGERLVHSHCYRADEILQLMRLAEEFGFRIGTLQHVLEGYKVADEIAAHGAGASTFSDWWGYKIEAYDAIPHNAALMTERGVVSSIRLALPIQPVTPMRAAASILRFMWRQPATLLVSGRCGLTTCSM